MKRVSTLVTAAVLALAATATPAIPRDAKMEKEIAKIVSKMSLDEKVGQMCQLTLGTIGNFDPVKNPQMKMDAERLHELVGTWKVGSFLNTSDVALTPEQWWAVIKPIQDESMKEIKIPCVYGLDMNHGASYTMGATLFPQNINMGATFNRSLATTGGMVTAYETRASDVAWTFNPTVDLSRNPLWPRVWENYGEDAFLSAQMGTAAVLGLQGPDPNHIDRFHIAANMKHFMGYGMPVSGKDRTHSSIGVMEMREKHFAPYVEAITRGHAISIMVNSATNNGIPFHANAELLTRWLKEQLDWDGMIVTDWSDINNLYSRDYIAADKKEAIAIAINAGIDMAMEPFSTDFCTLLKEAVSEGMVSMERIDDAVTRIIRMKMRLGLFKEPNTCYKDYPLFASEEFAAHSRRAATESMILLKNDDSILPLKEGTKILVTGPNANSIRTLNGGWTYSWQGHLTDRLPIAECYNTVLQAITKRFGADNVAYEPGVTYASANPANPADIDWQLDRGDDYSAVVAKAAEADVVVAVIGENSYCETPGNIDDLNLSPRQVALVKALYATGKPVVLILNEGRPRIINPIVDGAKAIVDIMLPSNYGGDALASLLAGDENFSGRLPITYPKHTGAFSTYDYKKGELVETMAGDYNYDARIDVQWPFGYGLSYTTFAYSNLRTDMTTFTVDDTLTFTVDVTNTGNRPGMESVLLFSSDLYASVSPDVRRLRQFEKVDLNPGQTATVTLTVPARDLAFVGADGKWVLEKGDFRIQVGDQSLTVTATKTHKWDTPNR